MLIDIYGNDPDIDGFRFCKKIMRKYSPTNWKPHINHVCIKDGIIYSTDGARLHSYTSKCSGRYSDGLWAITICRIGFIQIAKSQYGTSKYPDAEKIFDLTKHIHLGEKSFSLEGIEYVGAVFEIIRHGIKVNPQYISDIGGYFDIWIPSNPANFEHAPVIFKNGNKRAAIMPMRL